jgi:hypothetical protein
MLSGDRHKSDLRYAGLPPTFVVILPDGPKTRRRTVSRAMPELWPESDDPEGIVAEVLATCRGIERA